MSGEGFLPACPLMFAAALAAGGGENGGSERGERADAIAYLQQRRDNAETMATRWPDFEHDARVQRRQLDTIIGDFTAGMHEGAAGVRARLMAARGEKQS